MQYDVGPALAMLRGEMRSIVASYCDDPLFRDAILRVLARPGFALHSEARCRAGLLTLQVHHLVSGLPAAAAMQAATAAELHMQAAYVFDHLADRDKRPDDGITPAEELTAAIALLTCGQSTLCEAAFAAGIGGPRIRSLMRWAADCSGKCCTGQFLDAHLENQPSATTEESLKMTSLKAGSLGRFATGLGARLATDDAEITRLCDDFGFNLFTYFQLADDIRDACPAESAAGDLAHNKKTLPLVFLRNQMAERNCEAVCSIIPPESGELSSAAGGQEFQSSGARVFGAIVAEVFLNRAKSNLVDIRSRLGTVGYLDCLVSSFEINPEEILASL